MSAAFRQLLRWLAVFGMALAFGDFVLTAADGVSPESGQRCDLVHVIREYTISPRSHHDLIRGCRRSIRVFLSQLQAPSVWFCTAGILYLLARRRGETCDPPAGDDDV
jgi:hypothetical protein